MSEANAPPSQNVDEGGEIVLNRFFDFLAKFTSSAEGTTDGTDGVHLYRDYLAQIGAMVQNDKNTVYVDVQHVFAVRFCAARPALAVDASFSFFFRHSGSVMTSMMQSLSPQNRPYYRKRWSLNVVQHVDMEVYSAL